MTGEEEARRDAATFVAPSLLGRGVTLLLLRCSPTWLASSPGSHEEERKRSIFATAVCRSDQVEQLLEHI